MALGVCAAAPGVVQIALDGIGEHGPDGAEEHHHAADDVVSAVIFDAQFGKQDPGGVEPDQHDEETSQGEE